jgi:hypothetical protein
MKTEKLRVSLSFRKGSDHKLEETASAVLANLYPNPGFNSPPVAQTTLADALEEFQNAIAAQAQGGTAATAAKHKRREQLAGLLEQLALYVQAISNNDEVLLLSSGFKIIQPTRARAVLPAPTGIRIRSGNSGEAHITVDPIQNARCYEVSVALLDDAGTVGPWQTAGVHTSSRNMRVTGLIPGRMYVYKLRAVGGLTGYSGWSDAMHHRVA